MNCLYEGNRLCTEAHKVSEFNVGRMKDHCLNCLSQELTTIQGLFRLETSNWTADEKIKFALAVWDGDNVNLLDLSDQQKLDLLQIIRKKIPNFLPDIV
ncbi:MAG: hypothetical protein HWN65_03055 [Candidatus Helarchaeota archaeon]|nr:hypothetical protein [Candidatus Helarchaeota archaeon]